MNLPFAKSALSLGESDRVVSWCDDGLFVAEYALFDPSDLVLRAADRESGADGVQEAGYRTTARKALDRLARSGVTPSVADDVVRALSREVVRSLARCRGARAVANRLGAAEILDGARFSAATGVYQGAWIDLGRLSASLGLPGASALLQAFYLAAALAELPGSTPLFLSTAAALEGRTPRTRTYALPTMPAVDALFDAAERLAKIEPVDTPRESAARELHLRPGLLARIRERNHADASPAVRDHLEALEAAFLATEHETKESAPPAAPASAAIVLHASALPSLDRLGGIVSAPGRAPRYVPELVESLSTPEGTCESDLGDYDLPTTPLETRIVMTRLARDLAHEYRTRHGKVLRCDVLAIDVMQQHLLRWGGAPLHDRDVAWQLRRHGALLSEIFARVLGGAWIDLGQREAAYWMMNVRGDLRIRPIGCVFQYVAAGNRAGDLVGVFLDLERQGRRSQENLAHAARP